MLKSGKLIAVALTFAAAMALLVPKAAGAEELWQTLPFPEGYPEPASSGYSELNGIKLFHAEWGEGDPVILLHGGIGSIEAFAHQILPIAETHHVIAIDSRGHGRSTRDAQTYSYELMASDVLALMDEMQIPNAAFIGWSDGGILSLELAINHPDRISKAFVLGTNYDLSGIDPAVETNDTFNAYVEQAAALYGKNSATPDEFEDFVNDIVEMWSTQPNYTEAQLQTVSAPFVIAQALHDEAIINEHAEKMASLLPGATYLPLQNLSHFALWQDPQTMNAHIAAFLK